MRDAGSQPRYKRCSRCSALLRNYADVCPQCGLKAPPTFPPPPDLPAGVERRLRGLKEQIAKPPAPKPVFRKYVIIVAADRGDLFAYLSRKFSGEPGVEVVRERRVTERRRRGKAPPLDRRRAERRLRPELDREFRTFGFAVIVHR